jgi:hypothetical protein
VGAAIAVITTQASVFVILSIANRRFISLRALAALTFMPLLCAGIMGGLVFLVRPFGLLPAIATGVVSYPAALFLTRTVRGEDLSSVRNILGEKDPDAIAVAVERIDS